MLLAACGPSGQHKADPSGSLDAPSGARDSSSSSGGSDASSSATADAAPDASCGAQTQDIGVVNLGNPPDMLVVLDRSGSMNDPPVTIPPTLLSKWSLMANALDTITAAKDQNIKFGLMDFPSDGNCGASATPEIGIALGTSLGFLGYFLTHSPDGNTPSYLALQAALTYYQSIPVNPAGQYVIFATDGLPNCGGTPPDPNTTSYPETVAAVAALYSAGIKTYVIGFDTLGQNTGVLDDAATAGGEALPGEPKFYEASNATDLQNALQTISGGVIVPSCSFALRARRPIRPTSPSIDQRAAGAALDHAHDGLGLLPELDDDHVLR